MRKLFLLLAAAAIVASGCGYIVTPDDLNPKPSASQGVPNKGWAVVATKAAASGDALVVELTIRNDTGDFSEMHALAAKPATLSSGGKSYSCDKVFVGTGGWFLAPGFQIRGYTAGTKAKPETQVMSVECAGASGASGGPLSLDYEYTTGDFLYYLPTPPTDARLEVKLDAIAKEPLQYPVATQLPNVVVKVGDKIGVINQNTLVLTGAKRTDTGLTFSWEDSNPTEYPVFVHFGTAVVGTDGILYGLWQSPHLNDTKIAPSGDKMTIDTKVVAPADAKGLYLLLSVEDKQQKRFAGHVIDITDK
jgi:uncharacterized protein YceK